MFRRRLAGSAGEPVATADAPTSRARREEIAAEEGVPARGARRPPAGLRARRAGAVAVGTAGSGVLLLARLIMTLATLIFLLIVAAILLRDLDANAGNGVVKGIHDAANFFAGSFTGIFHFTGHPKRAITVNWGIAALVYLIVGALIARIIGSIGRRGLAVRDTAPAY